MQILCLEYHFWGHKFHSPIFIPKSKRQKILEWINHSTPSSLSHSHSSSLLFFYIFHFKMYVFFILKFTNVCAMQIAQKLFFMHIVEENNFKLFHTNRCISIYVLTCMNICYLHGMFLCVYLMLKGASLIFWLLKGF